MGVWESLLSGLRPGIFFTELLDFMSRISVLHRWPLYCKYDTHKNNRVTEDQYQADSCR